MIALASASDENKRLLNKIDSKSLLERVLKTVPPSQVSYGGAEGRVTGVSTRLCYLCIGHGLID